MVEKVHGVKVLVAQVVKRARHVVVEEITRAHVQGNDLVARVGPTNIARGLEQDEDEGQVGGEHRVEDGDDAVSEVKGLVGDPRQDAHHRKHHGPGSRRQGQARPAVRQHVHVGLEGGREARGLHCWGCGGASCVAWRGRGGGGEGRSSERLEDGEGGPWSSLLVAWRGEL